MDLITDQPKTKANPQQLVDQILQENSYLASQLPKADSKSEKWALVEFVVNLPEYQRQDVETQEAIIRLLGEKMPRAKAANITERLLVLADKVDEKGLTNIADKLTQAAVDSVELDQNIDIST